MITSAVTAVAAMPAIAAASWAFRGSAGTAPSLFAPTIAHTPIADGIPSTAAIPNATTANTLPKIARNQPSTRACPSAAARRPETEHRKPGDEQHHQHDAGGVDEDALGHRGLR